MIGPMDWRIGITDKQGRPTPEFQRRWNSLNTLATQNDTDLTALTTTVHTIGSYLTSVVLSGAAVSLVSGTAKNVTSISVPAGTWDITGNVLFQPNTTTVTTLVISAINTVSGTVPAIPDYSQAPSDGTGLNVSLVAPTTRLVLATTTTVYLVATANFTTSTMTACGRIRATRVGV